MPLIITGGSGMVGSEVIPWLSTRGMEIFLVSRDPAKFSSNLPGVKCISYSELNELKGMNCGLLHLAVMNNNADKDLAAFCKVNVDFTKSVVENAKRMGAKYFIYVSSTHALDQLNCSAYAVSKRLASKRLSQDPQLKFITLYLPNVQGSKFVGNLRFLNPLPKIAKDLIRYVFSALKPSIDGRAIANLIERIDSNGWREAEDQIILSRNPDDNMVYCCTKRLVDLTIAILVLLLFSWVFAIVWIAIKIESEGPGIFAQTRVGANGTLFTCYKFRTMKIGTENVATHQVRSNSVTRIGGLLRRSKIDELPQMWNVVKNDVSLVGPRPCLPTQSELVAERNRKGVLDIKPGITGYAQINDIDMSNPRLLAKWDSDYLHLRSLFLDATILIRTAIGKGTGDRLAED